MIIYKWVRRLNNGEYRSQFVSKDDEALLRAKSSFFGYKELTYRIGEVTKAPMFSSGIFCFRDVGTAEECRNVGRNHRAPGVNVLLEVEAIGRKARRGIKSAPHYMAVKPIREVATVGRDGTFTRLAKGGSNVTR